MMDFNAWNLPSTEGYLSEMHGGKGHDPRHILIQDNIRDEGKSTRHSFRTLDWAYFRVMVYLYKARVKQPSMVQFLVDSYPVEIG